MSVCLQDEKPKAEEKKKKPKKKKKKVKQEKSKGRDSSQEKKELNINIPEADIKPMPEKHFSDENNDLSEGSRALSRHRSRTPPDSTVFFKKPTPTFVIAPTSTLSSTQSLPIDVGDEPDVESDVEEAPFSPKRPKSRVHLNMLSHSEYKMSRDEGASDSSSGNSFRRHQPPQHHRPRKHHQRRSPMRDRSDSG